MQTKTTSTTAPPAPAATVMTNCVSELGGSWVAILGAVVDSIAVQGITKGIKINDKETEKLQTRGGSENTNKNKQKIKYRMV